MNTHSDFIPPYNNDDYLDNPENQGACQCGKPAIKRHCPYPSCGRSRIYGYRDLQVRQHPKTGLNYYVRVFRCEACGSIFSDFDWIFNCKST